MYVELKNGIETRARGYLLAIPYIAMYITGRKVMGWLFNSLLTLSLLDPANTSAKQLLC